MLSAERLREVLDYDAATGVFRWRVGRGAKRSGDVAGCLDADGYRIIGVDGRPYKAHRLAWLYVHGEWPPGDLDHKDNTPGNDWIDNLRPATPSQNNANSKLGRRNRSGHKGVSWNTRAQKWVAKVSVRGRLHYLGLFATVEEAHTAYASAAIDHHGEFARVR